LLAAGINQNLGGWPLGPGATEIETQLLDWFAARLGLPTSTSGAFVSGGATANLIALTVARDALAGGDVRRDGMAAGPPLAVYVSDDAHETIDRAADLLGLGTSAVRRVETDDRFRVVPAAVRAAIEQDIGRGVRPLCVVGTAGTTELGAIDPLAELADIAAAHGCWFHVDAAYGGPAAMVDELKPRFAGIERADSITCDPHKWLNTPISSSLVLIRDPARHLAAFTLKPDYAQQDAELEQDMVMRYQWTPQFTRPFDALPVWVSLLAHGWSTYARRIMHDIELTRWLHELVAAHAELEPLAEPELSIACFRYVPADLAGDEGAAGYLDELNEQIIYAVQRAGRAYPSNAVVAGRFAIRACLIGFRTEAEHVEALVDDVVRFGRQLDRERQAS
jgi:glutamate/tyrosine decarboxylase-like PLP-dependent enzyme